MTASNLTIHDPMDFSDYLQMPGYSYSGIKHEGREFVPTQKMITGTSVHQYLLEPHKFTGNIKIVKPIAAATIKTLGPLYKHLQYEMSISCILEHAGLKMPFKGRIDAMIPGRIVIDFKIGKNIQASKAFFGYDDQASGYAISTGAPVAFLIACNPEEKHPVAQVIPVNINHEFWNTQILLKGEL